MTFTKEEIIHKLKWELDILNMGGYAPSQYRDARIFRDSINCPNLGLHSQVTPCSECFLNLFVPPEHRDKDTACHHIPLNERGDTVASLNRAGDNEKLQNALRTWLQKTISRLAEGESLSPAVANDPPVWAEGSEAPRRQQK
jgi:hypothetical protein